MACRATAESAVTMITESIVFARRSLCSVSRNIASARVVRSAASSASASLPWAEPRRFTGSIAVVFIVSSAPMRMQAKDLGVPGQ